MAELDPPHTAHPPPIGASTTKLQLLRPPIREHCPIAADESTAAQPGVIARPSICRDRRLALRDGAETTLHEARFDLESVDLRVALLEPPSPLLSWCAGEGITDAMIGGFFLRPQGTPLGELRVAGEVRTHVPFLPPWGDQRACLLIGEAGPVIAPRGELAAEPAGDLLQAGPLLVRDGSCLVGSELDGEGFSAGAEQFDSDITRGRYPRAALGLNGSELIAAVCDGRAERDQGLTLEEMAEAMIELGAEAAINLDGGGSASLVVGGRLRNHPREEHGIDLIGGRAISTALVFEPRARQGSPGKL